MGRSRNNSYHKVKLDFNERLCLIEKLNPDFNELKRNYQQGRSSAAQSCAQFIYSVMLNTKNSQAIQGLRKKPDHLRLGLESLLSYPVRGLPLSAIQALQLWHQEKIDLHLHFDIPEFSEVLKMQSQGSRCVSLLLSPRYWLNEIATDRDPYTFLIHDLIHASHFFSNPLWLNGQINFYRWLYHTELSTTIRSQLSATQLIQEWEYMGSDMNSHPVHLLKCLKSCLTRVQAGSPFQNENFIQTMWSFLNSTVLIKTSWENLNTPKESSYDHTILSEFMNSEAAFSNLVAPLPLHREDIVFP